MILQALTKCYEALLKKGVVPKQGWCQAKVNFILDIDVDGALNAVYPFEEFDAKKKLYPARLQEVPEQGVRSSGIAPQFLCDNSSYILGIDKGGKPQRTADCFTACKDLHLQILDGVNSEAAMAVKNFFINWHPDKLKQCVPEAVYEYLINKSTMVFRYNGKFVHEDSDVQKAWEEFYDSNAYDKKARPLSQEELKAISKEYKAAINRIKNIKENAIHSSFIRMNAKHEIENLKNREEEAKRSGKGIKGEIRKSIEEELKERNTEDTWELENLPQNNQEKRSDSDWDSILDKLA